ncbi:MAG: CYTH domain-containing protein [Candidatus Paceibacterota bacterium]|jgi:adenylate cyclase class 2
MLKNNNREIETKLLVSDLPTITKKIIAVGGILVQPEFFQRTVRFDTSDEKLKKEKISLRVRTGDKDVITLKKRIDGHKREKEGLKEREELETEVEDIAEIRQILINLGFTREWIMEKYRTNYKLGEAVISLDRLPFGCFVEVEGEPEEIESVIQKLELLEVERSAQSYWGLFEEFKKKTNLTVENILFE